MNDVDRIAELRTQFFDAFGREDPDRLSELVTDDFVTMPPEEPAVVGRDANRMWWEAGFEQSDVRYRTTPRECEVHGEWAWERFDWHMELKDESSGNVVTADGKCLWIVKRQDDGSWRLSRAIWNSDGAAR